MNQNAQEMFRPFEFVEWITDNSGLMVWNVQQQINLADVCNYSSFSFPEADQFPKGNMCRIATYSGESYCANISYEDFRKIHHKFLIDYGIFDPRSLGLKKKVNNVLYEDSEYKPVDFHFVKVNDDAIYVYAYEGNDSNINNRQENPKVSENVVFFN